MNWNNDKSLKLSKFCIYIFAFLTAVIAVFAPWIFIELINLRGQYLEGKLPLFLASTYIAIIPAVLALYNLYRLLDNIEKEEIFVAENVTYLRRLSWLCIFAGIICFLSGFYYLPFLLIAVAAAFVGLILRVVKNVFSEAVQLKTENDFTI